VQVRQRHLSASLVGQVVHAKFIRDVTPAIQLFGCQRPDISETGVPLD
jgi:hypothetical protein